MEIICSVARNTKAPILFLPRAKSGAYGEGLPKGEIAMRINGAMVTASVAKIAINVVRDDSGKNVLPAILIGWFGESAGMPGTGKRSKVAIRSDANTYVMEPR